MAKPFNGVINLDVFIEVERHLAAAMARD